MTIGDFSIFSSDWNTSPRIFHNFSTIISSSSDEDKGSDKYNNRKVGCRGCCKGNLPRIVHGLHWCPLIINPLVIQQSLQNSKNVILSWTNHGK